MDKVMRNKLAIFTFVAPALFLFALVVFLPILMSAYYSFFDWNMGSTKIFTGMENYLNLFNNSQLNFSKGIYNSLLIAFFSVFIQLPISFLLAAILSKGIKGENFFRNVYFIPVVISSVVIGQLWLKIYNYDYGMLNSVLKMLGLEQFTRDWIGSVKYALTSVIIVPIWQYIGYHMLLFYAGIKTISPEVLESAKIDGASYFRTIRSIIIPMIMPIIEICVTFSIIGSLKVFDMVYIITNGGPLGTTEVAATLMYKTLFMRDQYGYGSAMASFIVVECVLLTVVIQTIFKKNYDKQ